MVLSPIGSMGLFRLVINLNSCLGLLIPHDMDRSLYHARARCRLRPRARL